MENDLFLRIGPEGSALPRIKAKKDAKLEIERLLASPQYPPQIRLRGYLAVSRVPPSDLITEKNIAQALMPGDCLGSLSLLARRIPIVDVEIPLASVSRNLSEGSSENPQRLASKLEQFVTKCDSPRASLRLTEKSIYQFIRLVDVLAKKDSSMRRDRKLSRSAKKPHNPFLPLAKLVVRLAMECEQTSRLMVLKLLVSLHAERTIDIVEQLESDAEFTAAIGQVWEKTIRDMEQMALEGKAFDFEEWGNVLRVLPFNQGQTKFKLEAWHKDAARLSQSIQGSLRALLNISISPSQVPEIIVDQSEAVQTTQLASVLLRAWDARDEGPNAKDAFEQMQAVLEGFFGIRIKGTVGGVENYNPRVHEVGYGDKPTTRVKLIRPWVELSHDGIAKVIVKAIVKSQA